MKNLLKITTFSFFLLLFSVQAQNGYSAALAFSVSGSPAFKVGLQGGNEAVLPDFGVHLALDTALFATPLSTDALHTLTIASSQVYLDSSRLFGTRATTGPLLLQTPLLLQNKAGLFSVVQPFMTTGQTFGVRLGLNFYFQN
jgi:hypothetical protein